MIFGIHTTSYISKLLYVISLAVRRVKFETILKYYEWHFMPYTTTEKFLQFDWLREVVFQLNLKYLHVKITSLLRVVV